MVHKVSTKSDSFVVIGSYDYRILKKIYENVLDEHIARECGEFFTQKMVCVICWSCHNLLDEIIQYNYGNNDNQQYHTVIITSLPRLVEHYWDGIGDWLA